jgi:hypothetical protein
MTSSPQTSFLSEIANSEVIPHSKLAYFQERQRNRIYHFVVTKFLELERTGKLTRAELARRIRRRPEQVTRWLGTPGNWTFDTLSDLLLGIAGEELEPMSSSLLNRAPRNYAHPAWVQPTQTQGRTTSSQPLNIIGAGQIGTTTVTHVGDLTITSTR